MTVHAVVRHEQVNYPVEATRQRLLSAVSQGAIQVDFLAGLRLTFYPLGRASNLQPCSGCDKHHRRDTPLGTTAEWL